MNREHSVCGSKQPTFLTTRYVRRCNAFPATALKVSTCKSFPPPPSVRNWRARRRLIARLLEIPAFRVQAPPVWPTSALGAEHGHLCGRRDSQASCTVHRIGLRVDLHPAVRLPVEFVRFDRWCRQQVHLSTHSAVSRHHGVRNRFALKVSQTSVEVDPLEGADIHLQPSASQLETVAIGLCVCLSLVAASGRRPARLAPLLRSWRASRRVSDEYPRNTEFEECDGLIRQKAYELHPVCPPACAILLVYARQALYGLIALRPGARAVTQYSIGERN